jgi:hypothetical protein
MKGPKLLAAIMLLSLALVCFISAPVFSGDDPWDVDGDAGGGSGSDGDTIAPVPDSLTFEETHSIGDDFGPDWLSGLAFQFSHEIIKYFFGGDNETPSKKRVVVEESSGNVTAQ